MKITPTSHPEPKQVDPVSLFLLPSGFIFAGNRPGQAQKISEKFIERN
jgi:hypothetical protein